MVNYGNGKVYKIWSPSTDKIYIGSTTKKYLSQRMDKHRSSYKRYQVGNGKYYTSYILLELNDYRIELLENSPCNDKNELTAREGYWIREYKDVCVNKKIEGRTKKEYYQDNTEKIKKYKKEWRDDNIEKKKRKSITKTIK